MSWKVTIEAEITTEVSESHDRTDKDLADAVDLAMDIFKSDHRKDSYKIKLVTAVPRRRDT